MKFLDGPHDPALDALLEEARQVSAPELDWEGMRAKLWQRIDHEAHAVPRRNLRALWLVPAVAAAAGALFWVGPKTGPAPIVNTPVVAQVSELDGDTLSANELLQGGSVGLRVVHRDRAEWTLEPNASASVLSHDGVMRIRLVTGALRAKVVPTLEKERFVVEAAGTRVAVHGTVFRVAMQGDRNLVEVEEGVVSVSSLDSNRGQAMLLRGPTQGEFALSGAPLSSESTPHMKRGALSAAAGRRAHHQSIVAAPPVVADVASTEPSEAPAPAQSTNVEASQAPAVNRTLTIGEVEAGVTPVVAAITRCFRDSTPAAGNLRITAQSAVTLNVAPDGSIEQFSFKPPLSPSVQSCTQREVAAIRFAPSLEGASVTRMLELTR
ncbi:MAG: FecR domain-containing protein [Myxococcota bacterium]